MVETGVSEQDGKKKFLVYMIGRMDVYKEEAKELINDFIDEKVLGKTLEKEFEEIKEDWRKTAEEGAKEIRKNYGVKAKVEGDTLIVPPTKKITGLNYEGPKAYYKDTRWGEFLRWVKPPAWGEFPTWVEFSEGVKPPTWIESPEEFTYTSKNEYYNLKSLIEDAMRSGGKVNVYGSEIREFENLREFTEHLYGRLGIKGSGMKKGGEEKEKLDVEELQKYGYHTEKVDGGIMGYIKNPINNEETKFIESPFYLDLEKNGIIYSIPKDEQITFEELVEDTGYEITLNGERKKLDPSEDNAPRDLPSELRRFGDALYKVPDWCSPWNTKEYNEYYDMF